jgi:hypothetical protein
LIVSGVVEVGKPELKEERETFRLKARIEPAASEPMPKVWPGKEAGLSRICMDPILDGPNSRHCERSEAIQKARNKNWIASSLALLAMTGIQQPHLERATNKPSWVRDATLSRSSP